MALQFLCGCAATESAWRTYNAGYVVWDERGQWKLATEDDDIYLYETGMDTMRNITNTSNISEFNPQFTSDGRFITYQYYHDDVLHCMIMRVDGSEIKELPEREYQRIKRRYR